MPTTTSFSPKLFAFLRALAEHNDRDWFKARKDEYDAVIKDPALDFINEFAPHLRKISPHFVADSRPVGGSLFRIHRDTRFSKDKTPYKTNTGLHFRHERAKDAHAPGFYLHLEPGQVFMGAGIWRPEAKVANQIREAIADDPKRWRRVTGKTFSETFALEGDSLKRPPRGFDPDHPLIDDLKRKDFIATTRLTQKQVTSSNFMSEFAGLCATSGPFVHFLCDALGVEY